ncbi:MAG: RNase adapter RapZ [Pseudomonadota bacterium]|nr:RNase adapter RapZ [Pseudomonadota bacterium]
MGLSVPRLVIVTGLSGAGKTVVLNALEDLRYYTIDNLPIGFLPAFLRHIAEVDQPQYRHMAIGIDARNPADSLAEFPERLVEMRRGAVADLVFVEADDQTLIRRFSETRRRHPLSGQDLSLALAIQEERRLLGALSERADLRIDTSHSSVHQLRDRVRERIALRPVGTLSLQFIAFGYKHGVPADADFVFDVRCLPNPYWEIRLRDLCGQDPEVVAYLEGAPEVRAMTEQIGAFLERWLPSFEAESRAYLTIAIGCTGGRHRSVYVAERLAERLGSTGRALLVTYRDM